MDGLTGSGATGTATHGDAGRRLGVLRTLSLVVAGLALVFAGPVIHEADAQVEETADLADPEVDVSAYADPPVTTVGDTVTFTVLVENTGEVPLRGLVITDADDVAHGYDDVVLPDDIVETTVTREIEESDARLGSVTATFVAEATGGEGTVVRSAAVVTVEVLGHPQERGAAWAGAPGEAGDAAGSRGLGAGASIAIVALFTILAALFGGWVIGCVGGARP